MTDKAKQLVDAHTDHVLTIASSEAVVISEVTAFWEWARDKPIKQFTSESFLQRLLKTQIADKALTTALSSELIAIVQTALDHPINAKTTLDQLVPEQSVADIADYIAGKQKERERLIHQLFNNPTYVDMLSQTLTHAINDFMQNNALAKSVPGVSSLMKFGKGVLEKATSSNLDETLATYISKNISSLIHVSERMTNRHLTNERVKQMILNGWKRSRTQKLSVLRHYADTQTVADSEALIRHTWDAIRVQEFFIAQLQTGISGWYERHADESLTEFLASLNIDLDVVLDVVKSSTMIMIKQMIESGFLRSRVENLMLEFYTSDRAKAILGT